MRTSILFAVALLATAASACDDTARGVQQDTADAQEHLEVRAAEAGAEAEEDTADKAGAGAALQETVVRHMVLLQELILTWVQEEEALIVIQAPGVEVL